MAMSGTLTASTAGVSMLGGRPAPENRKGDHKAQLLERLREPCGCPLPCSAWPYVACSGSQGASLARGREAIQAPPPQRNMGHPSPQPPPRVQRPTGCCPQDWFLDASSNHSAISPCTIMALGEQCGVGAQSGGLHITVRLSQGRSFREG